MANHEQDYCYDFSGHYAYILVSGKKSLIFEIVAGIRRMRLPFRRFGRSVKPARDGQHYDWFIQLGTSQEASELLSAYNSVLAPFRSQMSREPGTESDDEDGLREVTGIKDDLGPGLAQVKRLIRQFVAVLGGEVSVFASESVVGCLNRETGMWIGVSLDDPPVIEVKFTAKADGVEFRCLVDTVEPASSFFNLTWDAQVSVLQGITEQLQAEADPGNEVAGGDLLELVQDDVSESEAPQVTRESMLAGHDSDLRDRLKKWRRRVANELRVEQYVVLPNETLRDIAHIRPRSHEELLTIGGIGPARLDAHGDSLLREVFLFELKHGAIQPPVDAIHRVMAAKAVLLPYQDRELLDEWARSNDIVSSESAETERDWFQVLVRAEAMLSSGEREQSYDLLFAISDGEPDDVTSRFRLDLFEARRELREKFPIGRFNSMDLAEIEREVFHVLQQEGIDVGSDTSEGKFLWKRGGQDVINLLPNEWPFTSI